MYGESPFPQALLLPPPSPASWLQGWGNSAPLLHRPICTPSTESPQPAELPGPGLRLPCPPPPAGTLGSGVTVTERVAGLGWAAACRGWVTVPNLGLTWGGGRERVQWSSHAHGNCS